LGVSRTLSHSRRRFESTCVCVRVCVCVSVNPCVVLSALGCLKYNFIYLLLCTGFFGEACSHFVWFFAPRHVSAIFLFDLPSVCSRIFRPGLRLRGIFEVEEHPNGRPMSDMSPTVQLDAATGKAIVDLLLVFPKFSSVRADVEEVGLTLDYDQHCFEDAIAKAAVYIKFLELRSLGVQKRLRFRSCSFLLSTTAAILLTTTAAILLTTTAAILPHGPLLGSYFSSAGNLSFSFDS
jgi:hypothetical protein